MFMMKDFSCISGRLEMMGFWMVDDISHFLYKVF